MYGVSSRNLPIESTPSSEMRFRVTLSSEMRFRVVHSTSDRAFSPLSRKEGMDQITHLTEVLTRATAGTRQDPYEKA